MSGALLPLKTQFNAGSSLYAPASVGGGGGGCGGPDLAVSSIVINQTTGATGGALSFQYGFPFNSAAVPPGMVGVQQAVIKDAAGYNTNAIIAGANNASLGVTADFGAGRVIVGTQGTGGSASAQPTLSASGGGLVISPSLGCSSITVSSINGLQYPPGQTDNFSTLSVSSIGGVGGTPISILDDLNIDPGKQFNAGGSNAVTGASMNGWQSISCGVFETTAISPAYSATTIPISAAISANGISTFGTIYGNGNLKIDGNTDTGTAQIGTANITVLSTQALQASTILRLGNPQGAFPAPASATQGLLPLGIPGTADPGSYTNMIQGGYVSQLPYASTVLFTYPYQSDNTPLCVQITPTNQGVSAGQNPAISLNGNWGYAGTGVSSIGFSVDARNGGVGYAASFYWLAYPATQ